MPKAINTHCPWSGKPVSDDSLTLYRNVTVGFCNTGCRDSFARVTAALDEAIANDATSLNSICPWSGKPVSDGVTATYLGHTVGFHDPAHRDKFQRAASMFDRAIQDQSGTAA